MYMCTVWYNNVRYPTRWAFGEIRWFAASAPKAPSANGEWLPASRSYRVAYHSWGPPRGTVRAQVEPLEVPFEARAVPPATAGSHRESPVCIATNLFQSEYLRREAWTEIFESSLTEPYSADSRVLLWLTLQKYSYLLLLRRCTVDAENTCLPLSMSKCVHSTVLVVSTALYFWYTVDVVLLLQLKSTRLDS